MTSVLARALRSFKRELDRGLTPRQLAERGARYGYELASARLWLRGVNELGQGVRTLGRPRIDNHGFISIGAHTLLRSVVVPIELGCGPQARLEIGRDCSINYGVSIGCTASVRLGDRCRIGPYTMIIDTTFHDPYDRAKRPPGQPVIIESDVWLGAKVSVMPGVTIGRGAIVATGAVVTRDVEPFTVVAGVPARVVDRLDPTKFVVPSDDTHD